MSSIAFTEEQSGTDNVIPAVPENVIPFSNEQINITTDHDDSGYQEMKKTQRRYVWKSRGEHLLIVFGFTIGMENFFMFSSCNANTEEDSNIVHNVVIYSIVGLPVLYMEMFLGQYSQLGCLHIGKLLPIAHGVGASMLCISIYHCVIDSTVISDCLIYLGLSFSTELPWMTCGDKLKDANCMDYKTMIRCRTEDNCNKYTIDQFSAYIFWQREGLEITSNWKEFGSVVFRRVVSMLIVWILISIPTLKGIKSYKHVLQITVSVSFLIVMILILWVGVNSGANQGLVALFSVRGHSFISVKSWLKAVRYCIMGLHFSRAGHILYGTYLSPTAHSNIASILICYGNVCASLLGAFFSNMAIGVLAYHLKREMKTLYLNEWQLIFTAIPQLLGILPLAHIFTFLFFLLCSMLILNNQITQVDIISESIIEAFPNIRGYRNYIVFLTCGFSFFTSLIFLTSDKLPFKDVIKLVVMTALTTFVLCLETITVMYLYGIKRFSDDIQFLLGTQPLLYWKICWFLLPILFCFALVRNFQYENRINQAGYSLIVITYIMFVINLTPVILGSIYKFFKYLKYHHLMGLIKPEESWGPRNPVERKMRLIFNPRVEIRSRRRVNTCEHHCMINSAILKHVVAQEDLNYIKMAMEEEATTDIDFSL